jgi:hypothetical protein
MNSRRLMLDLPYEPGSHVQDIELLANSQRVSE